MHIFISFCGKSFCCQERQRLAVVRSTASDEQLRRRRDKECVKESMPGRTVHIDGFNSVIPLDDACVASHCFCTAWMERSGDPAGLRGTYQLIERDSEKL